MYSVRPGESVSDVVLNSTANILNWGSIVSANFYPTWTPSLSAGDKVIVPGTVNINNQNLSVLNLYPDNNASVPGIFTQLYSIFTLLNSNIGPGCIPIITISVTNPVLPPIDTNIYYTVRPGETIGDAVLNGSGDILNWDLITATGFFDTWTPLLTAGQLVAIPASVSMDLNNFRALNTYPANNSGAPNIYNQIIAIFDSMIEPNWILATGIWNGSGIWTPNGLWLTV